MLYGACGTDFVAHERLHVAHAQTQFLDVMVPALSESHINKVSWSPNILD